MMDAAEQAILVSDFMLRLAPIVTRRSLDYLWNPPPTSIAEDDAWSRHIADKNAMIILELASHLAAKFAQYHDAAVAPETKDTSEAWQETPAPSKQTARKPTARIQPPKAGILEGTPPVSDLP